MREIRTTAELQLNHHDRRRLSKMLAKCGTAQGSARFFRRLQAVLLVAQGRAVAEVARIVRLSPATVYRCIERYCASRQPAALADALRSGRPAAAADLTNDHIERELRRDPLALGYSTTTWTVPLLATHLQKCFGCSISPRTLRRRLHEMGWRWKRPRYVYVHKEPHRAQKKGR